MRTEIQTEYILPPNEWISQCDNPSVITLTNEGLLRGYLARGSAIEECNARMLRLIDWRKQYSEDIEE